MKKLLSFLILCIGALLVAACGSTDQFEPGMPVVEDLNGLTWVETKSSLSGLCYEIIITEPRSNVDHRTLAMDGIPCKQNTIAGVRNIHWSFEKSPLTGKCYEVATQGKGNDRTMAIEEVLCSMLEEHSQP